MAGLAVAAGLLVALPKTGLSATASHDPWKVAEVRGGTPIPDAFGRCEACHSMDTTEGEPGTSYISNTARTLPWIKMFKTPSGPFAPADSLACTFCHSTMLDNTLMEDALNEFSSTTIKHPVGRKVDGTTDTNNEWLSKVDSTPLADELQCTDCHLPTLVTYPFHEGATTDPSGATGTWRGTWDKTVNKYALRNVAAAGDADKKHCVNTCHGDLPALGLGVNSATKPKMGHYTYGNFNGTTIFDPGGQAMQVAGSSCVTCHDSHTSTKDGLIQDGIKRGGADAGRTAINQNNCVAVCHAAGAFGTHGHGGKVGINNTTCAPCHTTSVRHRDQTDEATRRRLSYIDPVKSNLTTNRGANGRDDDMDGVKDAADPDEATFAYSKTANCQTCHINYAGHGSGTRDAACLDCHDMHGDDAAINNNAAMIRSTIFGESVVFTAADRAAGVRFRSATANGVCDNDACHSNISGALGAAHLGGPVDDATDCTGCHNFNHPVDPAEPVESFKAQMNCAGCHSYPPVAADATQTGIVKVVDHTIRSRDGVAGTSSNAAFLTAHNGCTLCHGTSGNATLDGFANTEPGGGGKDAYAGHRNASVEVNGISDPDNNVNAGYAATNGQCSKACHSAGWVVGYATTPQTVYATGNVIRLQEYGSGACNSCHGGGNNATARANLWPDGQSGGTLKNEDRESAALRHEKHMEKLSAAVFSETIANLLLTTGNGTTDDKQKKLCAYCHADPFNSAFDPSGVTSSFNDVHNNGTVNVGGIYGHRQWDTYAAPFATTDGWTYTGTVTTWDGSCASVDCHDNKTTDTTTAAATTGYGWYDVATTACIMCHDDVTTTANPTGLTHEAHVDATTTTRAAGGAITCSSCHPGAPVWGAPGTAPGSPAGTGHINGTLNGGGGTVTYTFSGTFPTSTCGVNVCHNNGQNTTTAQNPYYWGTQYGGGTNTCVECHAASPTTQAHGAHLSGAFGRVIACGDCHAAATANTHANGTINLGGTVTFTYTGDVVVTANGGTFSSCGTNNCHRADTTGTAPAVTVYPWNNAPLANCSICHGDSAATLTSNAHDGHLGSNALPGATDVNECYACHNTVATSTGTLNAAGGHLDFDLTGDINFPTAFDYEAAGGTSTAGVSPATTCAGVRCHSGVTTPAWNTTAACYSCHNTSGTGPLPSAASVLGKHPQHANNDADYTDCDQCHPGASTYTPTGGTNHQNLTVNVSMTGITYTEVTGGGGVNYSATDYTDNGTCASGATGCHGTNTLTGGWATAATLANGCFACHNAAEVGQSKPAGAANSSANGVTLGGQYDTYGHGRPTASGNYPGSGNPPANMVYNGAVDNCYSCHDSAAAHAPTASAADPFRLGAYATNTDGLCTQGGGCHEPALIKTHSLAIVGGSATWPNGYAFKCVDCHDPHGDASYYMVRSYISAPTTTGDLSFGSNSYGTPQDTGVASAVTFTSLTGNAANSYGVDNATNGICEVCHVDTTNVLFYRRGQAETNTHNASLRCTGCHTHDKGFKGSCTDCHGSDTGENWPDGIANNPTRSAYADDAGAHDAHITAIGTAVPAAAGNNSCVYCHPGNPPTGHETDTTTGATQAEVTRMSTDDAYSGPPTAGDYWSYLGGPTATSGTAARFKNLAGSDDTNGSFNFTSKQCLNIDCHGGNATPGWYGDTTPPAWSGGIQNIQVADPIQGGVLNITWNTATDADSAPVSYILYRDTVQANVYTSPDATWTLTTNSYTDSGLTNGTPYYYGVKAIDSAPTPNATTEVLTANAAPSGTPGANTTDYYLTKNTGTLLYGATSTNGNACGTAWTVAQVTSTTYPLNGVGGLETAKVCANSSTTNIIRMTGMSVANVYKNFVAFYKTASETTAVNVVANATGNSFGLRSGSAQEDVRVFLAAVSQNGAHTLGTTSAQITNIASNAVSHWQPNMGALSIAVPAGSRLAVLFRWADVTTTAQTNDYITVDNYNTTIQNRIRLTETVTTDTTPPSWTGGVSGLTVTDQATGGELAVSWNTATDVTNPVSYRLYRSAAPDTNPLDNAYTTYGTTSIVDTGLVDGTVYYYHVKAIDNRSPVNVTTNNDVVSGTPTAGAGAACDTCHGTPPNTGAHLVHATADSDYTDCDKCHGNATYSPSANYTSAGPLTVHNNGTASMYFGRIPDADAAYGTGTDTCTNVDCHFGVETPPWVGGNTTCSSCHAYPPTAASGTVDHDANLTTGGGSLATFLANHGDCEICHGIKSATTDGLGAAVTHANYPAGSHGDGLIRMNGPVATATSAKYVDAGGTAGGCDNACHANDATFRMALSPSRTVNFADFGGPECTACHKAGGSGVVVTNTSPHVSLTVGGPAAACTACHPGTLAGTSMHQSTNVVGIPNYTRVGINYVSGTGGYSGFNGIVLGGDNTTGTTEAEICWNCHNSVGVTEWGTNNKLAGMPAVTNNYNYGTLNQLNWIGATWTSAQTASPSFSYKSGAIKSTHTANPTGAPWNGPTTSASNNAGTNPDTVAQIRCSYCHDVHDANRASISDTATGAPFLRGNWVANPYKEDGAPQSGQNFTNVNSWGAVPRATTSTTQLMGGYWIDKNMANPTSGATMTPNNFGGLCALCHGQTPGTPTWTAAGLDAVNQFEAQGAGWTSGLNGHKNAVKGATGIIAGESAARNIYNARGGVSGTSTAHNPLAHYQGFGTDPGRGGYGFRGYSDAALRYLPTHSAVSRYTIDEWSVDEYGTSAQSLYHQFTCSKCHNPHASRLPKLMITNCLDTKHNTWDNLAAYSVVSQTSAVNKGRSRSNLSSAQNCHRLRGDDTSDTRDSIGFSGAGWNTVTPW